MFSDVHNKINFPLLCDEKETITPGYVIQSQVNKIKWNNTTKST
jgi:hypothetical protein